MARANESSYGVWIRLGLRLLLSLSVLCPLAYAKLLPSQDGFISIDCGAISNHTDIDTSLPFTTDDGYISVGINRKVTVPDQTTWNVYSTARYFTEGRSKYCYALPVEQNTSYLIRPLFYFGDLETAVPDNYSFSVSIDSTVVYTLLFSATDDYKRFYLEFTFATLPSQTVTYFCLIPVVGFPFINSLELRPLLPTQYNGIQFYSKYTRVVDIVNCGVSSTTGLIRYPDDPFDRFWLPPQSDSRLRSSIAATRTISNPFTEDVPTQVLETAWSNPGWYSVPFPYPDTSEFYSALFFADIGNIKLTDIMSFDIILNSDTTSGAWSTNYTVVSDEVKILSSLIGTIVSQDIVNFSFVPNPTSTLWPILNAAELHAIYDAEITTTNSRDVEALNDLRQNFNLLSWTGDPCLPVSWSWINCSTNLPPRVTQLKLSYYGVKGTVPASIIKMTALTDLWLDNNFISGPIPDVSGLSYLVTLHLQNNSFTGTIPASLASLVDLGELYVGDNDLSGTVPAALENKPGLDLKADNAFSGNGSPSAPPSGPPPGPPLGPSNDSSSTTPKKKSLSIAVIIAAAFGIVVVILLIAFAVLCCCCMKMKKKKKISIGEHSPLQDVVTMNAKGSPLFEAPSDVSNPGGPIASSYHVRSTRRFSQEEVQVATNNFKRKIGEGGFGPVYYGNLPAGEMVAVKVKSATSGQGSSEFSTEVSLLSRVHHKNLVSLVGYCDEGDQQILIYEYMQSGTLREHLYGRGVTSVVDWKTRLDIALNAARGLEYLHNDCSPRIIHRDVKSSNILLNDQLVAKVADFGISKLAPDGISGKLGPDGSSGTVVSTVFKGTLGYLDPECFQIQKPTQKSDVYSFGVVLLEIIAGRAPIDDSRHGVTESNLVEYARGVLGNGNLVALVDKSLQGSYNMEAMWKLAELAMFCVEPRGIDRPDMRQVVREVNDAVDLENMTTPRHGDEVKHCTTLHPSTDSTQSIPDAYTGAYPSSPPTPSAVQAASGGVDLRSNPRPR